MKVRDYRYVERAREKSRRRKEREENRKKGIVKVDKCRICGKTIRRGTKFCSKCQVRRIQLRKGRRYRM